MSQRDDGLRKRFTEVIAAARGAYRVLQNVSVSVERERGEHGMCNCCGSRYWKQGGNGVLYQQTQGECAAYLCPQCLYVLTDSKCSVCNAFPGCWCSEAGTLGAPTPLFLHSTRVLSHVDAMRTAWREWRKAYSALGGDPGP